MAARIHKSRKGYGERFRGSPAGIEFEAITSHTLRHTFAARGLEQGIPLKVMQSICGYSSLAMTADLHSHDFQIQRLKR